MLRPTRPADDLDRPGRIVLDRAGLPTRAQPSATDPSMAFVTILDAGLVPSADHWRRWAASLAEAGYSRLRTGALSPRQAEQASRAGLVAVQELALLELALLARPPRPATHRLGARQWGAAAAVDRAAFGPTWSLDASMLDDIRHATPGHRARVVRGDEAVRGFLLSGAADRTGYIQRLAVDPAVQRQGIATALLVDALRWLHRSHVGRVYVNTHVDNVAALELYRRHGFQELPDRLRVFEGAVP